MSSIIYPSPYRKTILLAVIIGLGIFLLYELREMFSAILGAIVLYTLFKPFYLGLRNKKLNKALSAVIAVIVSLIIIVLPFIAVSLMIIDKIAEFQAQPFLINQFIQKINDFAGRQFHDPQFVQHKLQFIQNWGITLFSNMINSIFSTTFTVVMMYFILYFMLTDNEIFEGTIARYVPFKEKSTKILSNELRNLTRSNILGQGIIGVAQAVCVFSAFSIFKLPDPVFWGIIAGFVSFVPVFGVPGMFLASSAFCFLNGNNAAGIGLLIWGFVVIAFIENFLRMYIGRKMANAHPLITVIGILIGIPAFGIVGIVFGPLLLSYFILLISIYEKKYLNPEPEEEIITPS